MVGEPAPTRTGDKEKRTEGGGPRPEIQIETPMVTPPRESPTPKPSD